MNMTLSGWTNHPEIEPRINCMEFVLPSGKIVVLDRDETEWSVKEAIGKRGGAWIDIEFNDLYFYDLAPQLTSGHISQYYAQDDALTEMIFKALSDAETFISVDRDEIPDDYKIQITQFSIGASLEKEILPYIPDIDTIDEIPKKALKEGPREEYREYQVHVRKNDRFDREIDVFKWLNPAYQAALDVKTNKDEEIAIAEIIYDENDNELSVSYFDLDEAESLIPEENNKLEREAQRWEHLGEYEIAKKFRDKIIPIPDRKAVENIVKTLDEKLKTAKENVDVQDKMTFCIKKHFYAKDEETIIDTLWYGENGRWVKDINEAKTFDAPPYDIAYIEEAIIVSSFELKNEQISHENVER